MFRVERELFDIELVGYIGFWVCESGSTPPLYSPYLLVKLFPCHCRGCRPKTKPHKSLVFSHVWLAIFLFGFFFLHNIFLWDHSKAIIFL